MSKIVAMIDGSIYSQSVSEHTAWAAGRLGVTEIELVHVLGRREGPSAPADLSGSFSAGMREELLKELADLDELNAKAAQKRGRMILEEAQTSLKAKGIETVAPKLRHGDLIETLAAVETGADMVVIGKRGSAADFAKMHLGSNLERVVRSSHVPVLITSRAFKPIKRFLIAFDGGRTALKAVDYVARTALFSGLECHLLTVGDRSAEIERNLANAKALLKGGNLQVSVDVIPGQPDRVIAKYVEDVGIDLLVMGAYSHSRFRHLFLGSTTEETIRNCLIPALIYR
ncbi:universal stress protein [Thalassobaculum salexigens]|uniref:universal stress protein n=1 Tax=Thalassobaculum salexigens TaxID=455360 RepID=UPI000401072C|nr:universal stress protein [Thalassobaculum salexigens]